LRAREERSALKPKKCLNSSLLMRAGEEISALLLMWDTQNTREEMSAGHYRVAKMHRMP